MDIKNSMPFLAYDFGELFILSALNMTNNDIDRELVENLTEFFEFFKILKKEMSYISNYKDDEFAKSLIYRNYARSIHKYYSTESNIEFLELIALVSRIKIISIIVDRAALNKAYRIFLKDMEEIQYLINEKQMPKEWILELKFEKKFLDNLETLNTKIEEY